MHPRLRLSGQDAATNPPVRPAAGEILPALLAFQVHQAVQVLLPMNEPSLRPRPDSLQSPATCAFSRARHTMPQSAASPCLWRSSHWHAAPRSKLAAHTCLPRHVAGLTSRAPSPPESVPHATDPGPVPPAKPTLLAHSHARPAANPAAASAPAMPAPPPASEAGRTEHAPAEWPPRKAHAG